MYCFHLRNKYFVVFFFCNMRICVTGPDYWNDDVWVRNRRMHKYAIHSMITKRIVVRNIHKIFYFCHQKLGEFIIIFRYYLLFDSLLDRLFYKSTPLIQFFKNIHLNCSYFSIVCSRTNSQRDVWVFSRRLLSRDRVESKIYNHCSQEHEQRVQANCFANAYSRSFS